jgi:hypothetical protein
MPPVYDWWFLTEQEKRREKESKMYDHMFKKRRYDEAKLTREPLLIHRATEDLLRLHDYDTQKDYRSLCFDAHVAKVEGKKFGANHLEFKAERLLEGSPTRKKSNYL